MDSLTPAASKAEEGREKNKVLLTGGTGFIASHILDCLLDQGFDVVVTVRSDEKGDRILSSLPPSTPSHPLPSVTYAVVPDIAVPGAFDACLATATPPFTHVIHTASPVLPQLAPDADVAAVLLRPAIDGTTGILASIARHAPSVRRVVLTSSSAAILHPTPQGEHTVAVYDETHWAPADWDEAVHPRPHTRADYAYCTSKVLAERAAWAFVAAADAPFDLVTICNTYTFGPVPRHLPGLGAVNVSNGRIRDLVAGAWADRARPLPPTGPVPTFVDVRDVALAHVRALTAPAAGGERFYVVAGYFSNQRLAAAARRAFGRELAGRLPPEDAEDDFPARVFGFDNAKSRRLLGLEYRGLDESVRDTVASLLEHGAEARA